LSSPYKHITNIITNKLFKQINSDVLEVNIKITKTHSKLQIDLTFSAKEYSIVRLQLNK